MSTVPKYPLPFDPSDHRLDGAAEEVGNYLDFRGFPFVDGPDLERLRRALHAFVYGGDPAGLGWSRDTAAEIPQAPAGVDVQHLGRRAEQ